MKKKTLYLLLSLAFLVSCTSEKEAISKTVDESVSEAEDTIDLNAYMNYVAENAVSIDKLDSKDENYYNFEDYSIYLIGEGHGIAKSFDAELEMIKFLNSKYKVNKLFLEYGYSDVYIINEYLSTGDISLIENLVKLYAGTFGASKNLVEFFESLYEYNSTLPDENKITVVPGDVQHQTTVAAYAMSRLLPKSEAPAPIAEMISQIENYSELKVIDFDFINNLITNSEMNRNEYRSYLGEDNYFIFNDMISYLLDGKEYYSREQDYKYRENKMIEYFTSRYAGEKVMGVYGNMHTNLSGFMDRTTKVLAHSLNSDNSSTEGKVASISLAYFNSMYMDKDGTPTDVEDTIPMLTDTVNSMESDIYFCPLDLEGSPFAVPEERSLESQQYIITIRDSEANTIIK